MYRGGRQREQQGEAWGLQKAMMRIPGPEKEKNAQPKGT